jgi:hypothetical protein
LLGGGDDDVRASKDVGLERDGFVPWLVKLKSAAVAKSNHPGVVDGKSQARIDEPGGGGIFYVEDESVQFAVDGLREEARGEEGCG